MSSSFTWVLAFTLLGSVLSVAAAGIYLLLPGRLRERSLDYLLAFAIGMLLGAGFLHLLPEALERAQSGTRGLMGTALVAIVVFFLLEKALVWRHHHHHGGHAHGPGTGNGSPAGTLILIGDSFHNFLDGVLVAAAFHADPAIGVATATAVIAHEVPQELGDFAILLSSGYSRTRAFVFNLLTSLAMLIGAVLAWFAIGRIQALVPYLLAFTAASFVYVAVSDLMPALNRRIGLRETAIQVLLIGVGLAFNLAMIGHR